jgi:hypothetical protein
MGGMWRPSASAALRLTTNSYWVGCCTGRSALPPSERFPAATESGRHAIASGYGGRHRGADLIRAGGSATRRQFGGSAPSRQGEGLALLTGTYHEPYRYPDPNALAPDPSQCRKSSPFRLFRPVVPLFRISNRRISVAHSDPFTFSCANSAPTFPARDCALRCLLQKCRCSLAVIPLLLPLLSHGFPGFFSRIEVCVEIWTRRISDAALARG